MTRRVRTATHAVIIAGGAGERFWPASRAHHPKPLLEVIGGKSLLEATVDRARGFAGPDRVWLVCGHEHASEMRRASGLPSSRVLVEPRRRNTAMAIAWAALRIAAEDPDAVLAVLPADHHIPDARAFGEAIEVGARAAKEAEVLVTLGIHPTRPDTGYGYIQLGRPAGRAYPALHRVRRFVEKPDAPTARRYLKQGTYRWNAGVFVWSTQTLLEEIRVCAPGLNRALAPLRRRPRGRNREAVEETYRRAPSLPIDIAVLEKSRRVWCLPVKFSWSDVGTWESLAEELGRGASAQTSSGDNRLVAGELLSEGARGNLVWGGDRPIALVGVEDLAVIDTGDALLITRLDRSGDVRRIVAHLKAQGKTDLT